MRACMQEVQPAALPGAAIAVVGAKSDLYREGEGVDRHMAENWAIHHHVQWFDASAKLNTGVDHIFSSLALRCLNTGSLRRAGAPKAVVGAATSAVLQNLDEEHKCTC